MEKLQLPNPAPKGPEHEKWTAMVDSVIEFIAASRTMLHVLNERVKDSERFKEEEKRRIEDEKSKLAFYKECLHVEIKQRKDSKSATTDPVYEQKPFLCAREGGDAHVEKFKPAYRTIESINENGDKLISSTILDVEIPKVALVPNLQNTGDTAENDGKRGGGTYVGHSQQTIDITDDVINADKETDTIQIDNIQQTTKDTVDAINDCKESGAEHIDYNQQTTRTAGYLASDGQKSGSIYIDHNQTTKDTSEKTHSDGHHHHHHQTSRMCKRISRIVENETTKISECAPSCHGNSMCRCCGSQIVGDHLCVIHKIIESPKQNQILPPKTSVEIQSSIATEQVSEETQYLSVEGNYVQPLSTRVGLEKCTEKEYNSGVQIQSESTLMKSSKAQSTSSNKDVQVARPLTKDIDSSTIDLTDTKSSQSISKPMPPNQSVKCSKVSKIPRTKSFIDRKIRSTIIERTSTEEATLEKPACTKRGPKESTTYRHIYQRSKTTK